MRDSVGREIEANQKREQRIEESQRDPDIVDAVETAVGTFVHPLTVKPDTPEQREARREANDEEQRAGE
jgi:hypothetical protein